MRHFFISPKSQIPPICFPIVSYCFNARFFPCLPTTYFPSSHCQASIIFVPNSGTHLIFRCACPVQVCRDRSLVRLSLVRRRTSTSGSLCPTWLFMQLSIPKVRIGGRKTKCQVPGYQIPVTGMGYTVLRIRTPVVAPGMQRYQYKT
jgi:hypothetical protein